MIKILFFIDLLTQMEHSLCYIYINYLLQCNVLMNGGIPYNKISVMKKV